MKKLTACLIAAALFCVLPLTLSAADAENVRIDYKMNVVQEAYSGNYFSWAVGKNEAVKDMFDAASGASAKGSTKAFNSIRYAEPAADKKAAMPTGLRGLFLYPVAAWDVAAFDNLQVSTNGGIITVRFVHRGNAYELTTDKKGNFDILTGAKIARKVGDNNMNVFTVKPEYLKEGGDPAKMSDLDWSKITLEQDTFNPEAAYHYEGNLKFAFKNNILSISGIMKRK
ncbi:hypothetical protein [Treponema sp.]|uniref:hypothetical protein n=1 Tax=Treponema sp. TaxID=166 RepID=UPI003FA2DAB7